MNDVPAHFQSIVTPETYICIRNPNLNKKHYYSECMLLVFLCEDQQKTQLVRCVLLNAMGISQLIIQDSKSKNTYICDSDYEDLKI